MKKKLNKREQTIHDVIWNCYREMYRKAMPPADFDELVNNTTKYYDKHSHSEITTSRPLTIEESEDLGYQRMIDFDSYYLPKEEFDEIANKYIESTKFDKYNKRCLSVAIHLGAGPTSKEPENLDELIKKYRNNEAD